MASSNQPKNICVFLEKYIFLLIVFPDKGEHDRLNLWKMLELVQQKQNKKITGKIGGNWLVSSIFLFLF